MLIGNLTRDPNLRYTPNNTAVCSFGLATNRSWSTEDNSTEERTDFHNIVAWAKLAEICDQILQIGDKVYLEGRIQTRDWKTDSGEDRRITEIVLDSMIKLSSPRGGYSDNDGAPTQDKPKDDSAKATSSSSSSKSDDDDDSKKKKKEDEVDVEEIADDIPF